MNNQEISKLEELNDLVGYCETSRELKSIRAKMYRLRKKYDYDTEFWCEATESIRAVKELIEYCIMNEEIEMDYGKNEIIQRGEKRK